MKRLPASVFLLALLAAIMTGCTNTGRLVATGLKIELTGIERTSDGTVSATWQVANTNVVAYLLSHVSHKIYLNGAYLGKLEDREPLGIPAGTSAGRTSKLTGGDPTAARVLADAAASGAGNYRIDSQIIVLLYGDSVENAELTGSGTVPVKTK